MDTADEDLLGKSTGPYLSSDPNSFSPDPIKGPDDSFEPPDWFLRTLIKIAMSPVIVPSKPNVMFEMSDEARQFNHDRLREHGFDLSELLKANVGTTLDFGSEFRPVSQLAELLGDHPSFGVVSRFIQGGMPFVFCRELDAATSKIELEAALARGNHKSASDESARLLHLIAKDVQHGFSLPIWKDTARQLKGAAAQPLGLANQWTLTPDGSRTEKARMTQDLSFSPIDPDNSINSRIDMSAYPEMVYGWCLSRILHFVVALRLQYPSTKILIAKYDYSDAYRRMAHDAKAAAQTIAAIDDTAFVALRLTFGGSPNPPAWCAISEMVADLANEISQCRQWDPELTFNPAQRVSPKPSLLPTDVPMGAAREMSVSPHPVVEGRVDVFIDDLINVFLDTPANRRRQPHVAPLAAHIVNRPHVGDNNEPVPRRPIINIPKLLAEGTPAEIQIVLGWTLDTRRLLISLPDDKMTAWTGDITVIRKQRSVRRDSLESLIGRLNHAAAVMPLSRHFLGRLRRLLAKGKNGFQRLNIRKEVDADLELWSELLLTAHRGISLNCLVTRRPDRVCWSDSCPYGIAGYSISGRAWRIRIPQQSPIYGHPGINNFLEFLGMAICIHLELIDCESASYPCILSLGDSTSAIGWLHNTSRLLPNEECHAAHLFVARSIATTVMNNGACLATQHIKGKLNVVADLMSYTSELRDGSSRNPIAHDEPSNDELTQRLLTYFPHQVPANFKISQLPPSVLFWATRALQIAELSLTRNKKPVASPEIVPGVVGTVFAEQLDWAMTPSSLCYDQQNELSSVRPSYLVSDLPRGPQTGLLASQVRDQYSRGLSVKPQATWLRRFGSVSNQAPCTARAVLTSTH